MDELLVLTHRIPYPPDKGDKIRSWSFLRHLAERYDVYLGTFVDEERDWQFTDVLRRLCRECFFVRLDPRMARLRSLRGVVTGDPLTLPYYFDRGLAQWVRDVLNRPRLGRVFIYCSAMAQYIPLETRHALQSVADLVDIDSEKWFEYGRTMRGLKAQISRREGQALRRVECEIAATFKATFVATKPERDLIRDFAPESAERIECIRNGVDTDYFSPDRNYDRPAEIAGTPLVFTGAMDYWPNVDAAVHFVTSIFPRIRQRIPDARAIIVGSNPARAVKALARSGDVVVTGRVPDVRPFIAHASAIVAPIRVARGVQNKVLEGMAMAKPVIASPAAATGIEAEEGKELLIAESADSFAAATEVAALTPMGKTIGESARRRVIADYDWSASTRRLELALNV